MDGDRLTGLNEAVIYDAIATYLERWFEEHRHDLPLPRDGAQRDYRIISPPAGALGTVPTRL